MLIGWIVIGGTIEPEPPPFDVQDVYVISNDEFRLLQAVDPSSEAAIEDPIAPDRPSEPVEEVPDELEEEPQQRPPSPLADTEPTPPETPPEVPPDPTPSENDDTTTPDLIPPAEEIQPDAAPTLDSTPQAAERIAPEIVAPPPPETTPSDIEQEAVVLDDGPSDIPQDIQEATSPEEATTEIVTEAEEPAHALARAIIPPARPQPVNRDSVEEEREEVTITDAVESALADVLAAEPAPDAASRSGPPLSSGEKGGLIAAISNCWNLGSLSTEALGTTVVVRVSMTREGRPEPVSLKMLSFSGGSESAARQAFEAARRAIIRCSKPRGYNLPIEKYDHWRNIEITFNPEQMRIK